jgi:hypothetical protein
LLVVVLLLQLQATLWDQIPERGELRGGVSAAAAVITEL